MSNDLILTNQGELISYIHNENQVDIPKPFEKEIFLFDTYIAGTSYIEGFKDGSLSVEKGEKLEFYREPNNEFDKNAIVMKNHNSIKVGYVPREDNIIFSRLMDAGKELYGKVTNVETRGDLLKIRVKIYLKD
jgi:hypothetical protein